MVARARDHARHIEASRVRVGDQSRYGAVQRFVRKDISNFDQIMRDEAPDTEISVILAWLRLPSEEALGCEALVELSTLCSKPDARTLPDSLIANSLLVGREPSAVWHAGTTQRRRVLTKKEALHRLHAVSSVHFHIRAAKSPFFGPDDMRVIDVVRKDAWPSHR